MRKIRIVGTAAVALAALFVACGSPTQSGDLTLRIDGPLAIAPGTTGQFTATEVFKDGGTADVTKSVAWTSTGGALRFGVAGQAQAVTRGETSVRAVLNSGGTLVYSQIITVFVLEPGTFRVSGKVTEGTSSLGGATVQVVTGTGTGLSQTTSFDGSYALYGVAGPVQIQASSAGYQTQVQSIVVNDIAVLNFNMTPTIPPADISGPWTMTLSASPGCAAKLPDDARQRSYGVAITQDGSRFQLTAFSSLFLPLIESGRVQGQLVSLTFFHDTYYGLPGEYDLLELLSPTRWLGIYGSLQATVSGSGVDGTLNGTFDYMETKSNQRYPSGLPLATCSGSDAAFVLRRNGGS